jgi:hypothetical protein
MPAIIVVACLPVADAPIYLAHQIRLGIHVSDEGHAYEAWLILYGWQAPDLVARYAIPRPGRWRWIGPPRLGKLRISLAQLVEVDGPTMV